MFMKHILILFFLAISGKVFAFDLEKNKEFYSKLSIVKKEKFSNDLNIHISLLEHPEITASEANIANIDKNSILVKTNYEKYLDNKNLDFARFKKDVLNKVKLSLKNIDFKLINGKNINIIMPHMIDLNKPYGLDMKNKYAYFVNTDVANVFLVSPSDYGFFLEDITYTVMSALEKKKINGFDIHYILPACGVHAKDVSVVLKKYKTEDSIGTLDINDKRLYVESSNSTLGQKTWNTLKSDTSYTAWLKNNNINMKVSFCNSAHCYNRTPEDALEFVQNNKSYHFGELLYNGVENFLLGAVSLWPQEKDYVGFVSKNLIKQIQDGTFKLEIKPNSFKHITDNPTASGKSIRNIKLNDRALTTEAILSN